MKASKNNRVNRKERLHKRIRRKVVGSTERPRLSVCFTGRHIHAQIIDDAQGLTVAAASTNEKSLAGKKLAANASSAEEIGKLLAERAKDKKIEKVVFDRGGSKYHGKVKALADSARESGLEF